MSGKTFAQELAEKCARWENEEARDSVVVRARHGGAVLAAQTGWIRCRAGAELETVRSALTGLIEAGIEEGRRWQSVSPDALAAAHEEGRRAGWEQAMFRLSGEAASLCDKIDRAEAVVDELRTRLDAIATVRAKLATAMPEGGK